jgi:hypothetical protein
MVSSRGEYAWGTYTAIMGRALAVGTATVVFGGFLGLLEYSAAWSPSVHAQLAVGAGLLGGPGGPPLGPKALVRTPSRE